MINNSTIHNGLTDKEIRDFLSLSLVEGYQKEFAIKKNSLGISLSTVTPIEYSIKTTEEEIRVAQEKLACLKSRNAILKILKSNNWQDWDISDHTIKDLDFTLSMNFIGTEEEYNQFILANPEK